MNVLQIIVAQNANFSILLQIYMVLILNIRQRRMLKNSRDASDLEMINMIEIWWQNVVLWLQIVHWCLQILQRRHKLMKLYKPHLLMQLITGYR